MFTHPLVRYWCVPMFTIGTIRGYRAERSQNLLSDKLCYSFLNGCFYVYPFFGPVKLMHIMDRIQVRMENKNPDDYPMIYQEARGINRNTLL
jgi:hypothetical protein